MKRLIENLIPLGLALAATNGFSQSNTFPSSGNAGIGTTSPQMDLHLYSTSSYRPQIQMESVGDTGAGYLILQKARAGSSAVQSGDGMGTLLFQGYSNGGYRSSSYITAVADTAPSGSNVYSALAFFSNHPGGGGTYENMRIASSGSVGIGTSNPLALLHTSGSFRADGEATFTGPARLTSGTVSTPALAFWTNTNGLGFYRPATDALGVVTNSTERIRVDASGNVGIGTISPTHKLAVNGTIRAKEMIVDTGWSDYVFAEDYQLTSLSEVEAHIKEHKHLPGIPSAEEIEQEGVNLGEMQAKLLAKIEELTLHVIRLEKRLESRDREVSALRMASAMITKGR